MRNYEESKDISSILGTNKIANKPTEISIAPIRPVTQIITPVTITITIRKNIIHKSIIYFGKRKKDT